MQQKKALYRGRASRESLSQMSGMLPRQVWAFWFGPQMQGNRRQSYDNLNKRIGVPLILVDDHNLANYTLPDFPIHPAFQYLTPVHKSDYLWAYFGHHYGGGFHDIKAPSGSWAPFFDKMQNGMDDAWIFGTSEPGRDGIACRESAAADDPACLSLRATRGENATMFRSVLREFPNAWVNGVIDDWDRTRGACCERVRDMFRSGLQVQHYIVRPRTPLTADYLRLTHASLDHKAERLRLHPAPKSTSRCCFNHEGGYPMNWAELKGEICHPLYVKYASYVKGGMPMKPGMAYRDKSEDGTKVTSGPVIRHAVSPGQPRSRVGTSSASHRSPRQISLAARSSSPTKGQSKPSSARSFFASLG